MVTSWIFVCLFYIYLTIFRINLINSLKNPTSIKELECMEYIYDKIICTIIKFDNLYIYFKTRVVDGIIG